MSTRPSDLGVPMLLERTLELIGSCDCECGCPACIYSNKCGNGNVPLDKEAAVTVLKLLLDHPDDLERATRVPGRAYRMAGCVRRGQKRGRTLGSPPANLALHRKVVPLWGIFAVRATGAGLVDHPAVASLGTRPTVNGTDPLLEVHLFDYDGSLYGRYLDVDFVARLRDEQKFPSLDALVAQMHRDAAAARAVLGV